MKGDGRNKNLDEQLEVDDFEEEADELDVELGVFDGARLVEDVLDLLAGDEEGVLLFVLLDPGAEVGDSLGGK